MNAPRQSLARKWRPQSFAELCGHDYAVRAVQNAVHRHHAFLFTGTRGVGKTTLARLVAKTLNCQNSNNSEPCMQCNVCVQIAAGSMLDVIELDAASHTKAEEMRELLDSANHPPMQSQYKVFIIDEAHMLSKHAFASMLKTLEEPPDYLKFVLATTDPQRMPATILSRCLCFHLRPLERAQISERLAFILRAEKHDYEEAAVREVARQARGSMRDALSIAEQAIAHSSGKLQAAAIRRLSGEADAETLARILSAVAAADHAALAAAAEQLVADGAGFDSVLARLAAFLYKIALAKIAPNAAAEDADEQQAINTISELFDNETLQVLYEIAVRGRRQLPWAPDEQTGFEMTLLRMALFSPAAPEAIGGTRQNGKSRAKANVDSNVAARANATTATAAAVVDSSVTDTTKPTTNGANLAEKKHPTPAVDASPNSPLYPSSVDDWQRALLQISPTAKALADFCTLKEINASGAVLVLDKSATGNHHYLPELQRELQRIFHAEFTIHLAEGEDNAAAVAREESLQQAAAARPFVREILKMPEASIVVGSIHLENTSGEPS